MRPQPAGQAYLACQERISGLVRNLDPDVARSTLVPACPGWSVHDVISHLVGVAGDYLTGRLEGVIESGLPGLLVGTDPWTEVQVVAGRHRSLGESLATWERDAPRFADLLDRAGAAGLQGVADVVTHEHDVRGAMRQAGDRDTPEVAIAVSYLAPLLVASGESRGVAVRIEVADGDSLGSEPAALVLRASGWEVLRATTGRRSVDQLAHLTGTTDRETVDQVFTFGPFRPAASPIEEPVL